MAKKTMKVDPKKIVVLEGTYPRSRNPLEIEDDAAAEKAVAHLRGADFPLIVTANGGTNLVDGAHRLTSLILDGAKEIEVQDLGTLNADRVLKEAIKRNATHGKQLSLTEKARLARRLEGTMKQAEMAKVFAVSTRTISRWVDEVKEARRISKTKKALKLIEKGMSVNAAAKEIEESRSTLTGWLKQAEGDPTFTEPKKAKAKAKKKEKAKAKAAAKAEPNVEASEVDDAIDEIVLVAYNAVKAVAKAHDKTIEDVGFEVIRLLNERL